MLVIVKKIDEETIERLLSIYSESMESIQSNFKNKNEMIESYIFFLKSFIENPKHLIIVEQSEKTWVSGLRAIETEEGKWFLEAVETKPEERRRGYGKELLEHAVAYLRKVGMNEVSCTIAENNLKSQELHKKCGFVPTVELPMNPWGEIEDGRILYKMKSSMD